MKKKQRTRFIPNQDSMASSEDDRQSADYARVSSNEGSMSPTESEIATTSSEGDSNDVGWLEKKLYSVVALLEEAINGHRQLRSQILPQQRLKFDQLFDELQKSLSQIKTTMELNTSGVKELPTENMALDCETRTVDSGVDSDCTAQLVPNYADSIPAQIEQFINWNDLWQTNLMKNLRSHSEEINQKLNVLMESARTDCQILRDDRQPISNSCASVPDLDKSGAICHHPEQKPYGYRIGESLEFANGSHSDRLATTPAIQTDGKVAKPKVLCVSIAPVSPISPEHLRSKPMGNTSPSKLQQILTTLQRKQEEQLLSSVSNPQEVCSLRAEASRQIEELWQGIETHRVEALPNDFLGEYMRTVVLLSLVVEDKRRFYEHTIFCAQQLRNPTNINELAILTTPTTDANVCVAPPLVDRLAFKSSKSVYLLSLMPEEKRFYTEVTKLKPRTLVIWCSAYACLLLRLGDRGVGYVRQQLTQLNRQLAIAYHLDERSLPRVPLDSSWYIDRLRKYSNYKVDEVRKNTLYKGLIERYECSALPQRTKKFLNFLLLSSLRYQGMSLITLVDECRKLYGISLDQLVQSTLADETRSSWQTYERAMSTYIRGSLSKKYKYCQVFCPQMYSELRFEANLNLCLLLCVLVDIRKLKIGRGSRTALYHRIVKWVRAENGRREPWIDATWKRKCVQILKKFVN